ncbi:hypothetical protein BJ165DRAFT_862132 [Panaeolus papilionaceus]|nr:hypothetical protein BJ165DRAFT_862132 [Panaeolus papilionaceus]
MERSDINGVWNVTLPLPPSTPFEYKYIQKPNPSHVIWDNGPNRRSTALSPPPPTKTSNSTETTHVTFQVYAETVWGGACSVPFSPLQKIKS